MKIIVGEKLLATSNWFHKRALYHQRKWIINSSCFEFRRTAADEVSRYWLDAGGALLSIHRSAEAYRPRPHPKPQTGNYLTVNTPRNCFISWHFCLSNNGFSQIYYLIKFVLLGNWNRARTTFQLLSAIQRREHGECTRGAGESKCCRLIKSPTAISLHVFPH